jgi:hypothetical protein
MLGNAGGRQENALTTTEFRWIQSARSRSEETIYMIDRFPPDAAHEAVSTLIELHDLWKADVLVGNEIADDALDVAAYALYRSGVLDDLVRRVSRTYRPDLSG